MARIGDGVLGEDWPLPSDVGCLWRLMTIDGIGAKTVTALLDGLKDDACRRTVEEIELRHRIITSDAPGTGLGIDRGVDLAQRNPTQ